MKSISEILASLALATAKEASGAASQWAMCQPEEPKELKTISEK